MGKPPENSRFVVAFFAHRIFSEVLSVTAQHDVGTTTGHVGCDGDSILFTCLRDDFRFFFMVFCIQYFMLDTACLQHFTEHFRLVDGDGTDQNRLVLFMALLDLCDNRQIFSMLIFKDNVVMVDTDDGFIGRNLDNVQMIDFSELSFFGHTGTGHAGQFFIGTEEVLEGDGREGFGLLHDLNAFFGLDCLMQTFVVAAALHQTAGEFVNDDDLSVLNDIVDLILHAAMCFNRLVDMMQQGDVFGIHQVVDAESAFCFSDALRGQGSGLSLFVDDIVAFDLVIVFLDIQLNDAGRLKGTGEAVSHLIHFGGLFALAGDDQRGTRFVDQDGVDLVDDGKVKGTLNHLTFIGDHVVAEEVEADLVIGAVGDIACVSLAALSGRLIMNDQADRQAEEAENLTHPFRVTFCEVVVDGNDMDTFTLECVEVCGEGFDHGFTFTGTHLSDTALMEDDTAKDLNGVMFHIQDAGAGLTADSESVGEDSIERFTVDQTTAEVIGLGAEFLIAHCLIFFFECEDFVFNRFDTAQFAFRVRTEDR